jgi:hypothetical protein
MTNGRSRPSAKNSPVMQYIANSIFKDKFIGLDPATSAFDSKWRELASSNATAFNNDQHDYIKRKYYDVAVANLQRNGLDLTKFGPAVQDLIWSGAVQFGPANIRAFTETLKGKSELTDKDIVNLVSEWKINNISILFSSSTDSIRTSQKSRYAREKTALLKLIK